MLWFGQEKLFLFREWNLRLQSIRTDPEKAFEKRRLETPPHPEGGPAVWGRGSVPQPRCITFS